MYISVTKSNIGETYYLSKSFRDKKTGKNSSKNIERIGTKKELIEKLGSSVDLNKWLNDYAKKRTEEEKGIDAKIQLQLRPKHKLETNNNLLQNIGYLFINKILYDLQLDKICKNIQRSEDLDFDLFSVFSSMILEKIFSTDTSINTYEFSKTLLKKPKFSNHNIYETIKILSKYCNDILIKIHENERGFSKEINQIIFYDSFNLRFNNRNINVNIYSNQDSTPIAFSWQANSNGLSKIDNYVIKKYKDLKVYTCPNSLKLKSSQIIANKFKSKYDINLCPVADFDSSNKRWILNSDDWQVYGNNKKYNIAELSKKIDYANISRKDYNRLMNVIFYKKKKLKKQNKYLYGFFNFELQKLQKEIRENILDSIEQPSNEEQIKIEYKKTKSIGEQLKKYESLINNQETDTNPLKGLSKIFNKEYLDKIKKFDGYYAFYSDLDEKNIFSIVNIIYEKSQIESLFTNISNEYKPRLNITIEDSISAHLLTSFIAVLSFKLLEIALDYKYWNIELIQTLRNMNLYKVSDKGYIPTYTPNKLTNELHEIYKFNSDYEFITNDLMKKILKQIKQK